MIFFKLNFFLKLSNRCGSTCVRAYGTLRPWSERERERDRERRREAERERGRGDGRERGGGRGTEEEGKACRGRGRIRGGAGEGKEKGHCGVDGERKGERETESGNRKHD